MPNVYKNHLALVKTPILKDIHFSYLIYGIHICSDLFPSDFKFKHCILEAVIYEKKLFGDC